MKKCYTKLRFITRAPSGHFCAITGNVSSPQSSPNSRNDCYLTPPPPPPVGSYDNLNSNGYSLDKWCRVTLPSICLHMLKFVLSPQEIENALAVHQTDPLAVPLNYACL